MLEATFKKERGLPCLYRHAETKAYWLRKRKGNRLFSRCLKTRSLPTARRIYAKNIEALEEEIENATKFEFAKPPSHSKGRRTRIKFEKGVEYSFGIRISAGQRWTSRRDLLMLLNRMRNECVPLWGNKVVSEISYADVKEWAKDLRREKANAARMICELRRVFQDMIDYDRRNGVAAITPNPADGIKGPKKKRRERSVITLSDIRGVLNQVQYKNTLLYNFLKLILVTGAKPDEAIRLRIGDIDFADETITYTEQDARYSAVTYRKAPLSKQALDHCMVLMRSVKGSKNALVFEGLPDLTRIEYLLRVASNEAGVRRVSKKHFQQFFIESAIRTGLNPIQIANLVGHRDGGAIICQVYRDEFLKYSDYTSRIKIEI